MSLLAMGRGFAARGHGLNHLVPCCAGVGGGLPLPCLCGWILSAGNDFEANGTLDGVLVPPTGVHVYHSERNTLPIIMDIFRKGSAYSAGGGYVSIPCLSGVFAGCCRYMPISDSHAAPVALIIFACHVAERSLRRRGGRRRIGRYRRRSTAASKCRVATINTTSSRSGSTGGRCSGSRRRGGGCGRGHA